MMEGKKKPHFSDKCLDIAILVPYDQFLGYKVLKSVFKIQGVLVFWGVNLISYF